MQTQSSQRRSSGDSGRASRMSLSATYGAQQNQKMDTNVAYRRAYASFESCARDEMHRFSLPLEEEESSVGGFIYRHDDSETMK